MDREVAFGLLFAVIGTVIVSSIYFGEGAAPAEAPGYAPDDIRHPLHQTEQNAQTKAKKKHAPEPAVQSDTSEEFSESETSDAEVEQPPAEEPEIE